MDSHRKKNDDNYSILTLNQPRTSLSTTSSNVSLLITLPEPSGRNGDHSMTRRRSLRKPFESNVSCYSNISTSSIMTIEKPNQSFSKSTGQEARPLGTCVRQCSYCQQMKHILLAECTACYRMMDIDLKDCKCQTFMNGNPIDRFYCSICNTQLTLNSYIICANRTCQTTLSGLVNETIADKSIVLLNITNVSYPNSVHRTVAVQVNTLRNLSPLERLLPTIIGLENEKTSSNSFQSLNTYHTSDLDGSLNKTETKMMLAYNSNRPTKQTVGSTHDLQQVSNFTNAGNTDVEANATPKSPQCLAIMSARKHCSRLTRLLPFQTNKLCQTELTCLKNINPIIGHGAISSTIVIQTNNPERLERQIQVDTLTADTCRLYVENHALTDAMNEEKIYKVLADRDGNLSIFQRSLGKQISVGQHWSELVCQLMKESSQISPSEIAQQLLDTVLKSIEQSLFIHLTLFQIERLHTNRKLNNIPVDQLQRRIRYAMSEFKSFDEDLHRQINRSTTKTNHKTSECSGCMDMAVTVRQIHRRHDRGSTVATHPNWKRYVDRLFEQGHSSEEIEQLLRKAAAPETIQNDDQRLQGVFNYINSKERQERLKAAPTGIEFVASQRKPNSVASSIPQPTRITKSEEVIPNNTIADKHKSTVSTNVLTQSQQVNDVKREIAPIIRNASSSKLRKSVTVIATAHYEPNESLATNIKQLVTVMQSNMTELGQMDHEKIEILMMQSEDILNKLEVLSDQQSNSISSTVDDKSTQINENVVKNTISKPQSADLLPETTLEVKPQSHSMKTPENTGSIQCRPLPYMLSSEKISTETLKQVLVESAERDPLTKDDDPNDQHKTKITSSQTDDKLHTNESETKWLNSLLSKISDHPSNTTDTVSTSLSRPIINQTNNDDNNRKEDEVGILEVVSNVDRVIFNKEHVGSNIAPKPNSSISHEPYQMTESKLIQRLPMMFPQEIQGTQASSTSIDEEKTNDNDRDEHSDTPTASAKMFKEGKSSTFAQSTVDERTPLDQAPVVALQRASDTKKDIKALPILPSDSTMTNETHTDVDRIDSEKSSISVDTREDDIIRNTQSTIEPEQPSASLATLDAFQPFEKSNRIQLPVTVQQFIVPHMIHSRSSFIHLNDYIITQESKPRDGPTTHSTEKLSADPNDENIDVTSALNDQERRPASEKMNGTDVDNSFKLSTSSTVSRIVHPSMNIILSPAEITRIINNASRVFATLMSNTPEPLSSSSSEFSQVFEYDEFGMKPKETSKVSTGEISESVVLSPETPFLNEESQFHRSTSEETKAANNDDSGKDLHHKFPDKYDYSLSSKKISNESDFSNDTLYHPAIKTKSIDEQPTTELSVKERYSQSKILAEDVQTPSSLSFSYTSTLNHTDKEQHDKDTQPTVEDTVSSLSISNHYQLSDRIPVTDANKVKSLSKESIGIPENVNIKSNKSAHTSHDSDEHRQEGRYQLEHLKKSLKNDHVDKLKENLREHDDHTHQQKSGQVNSGSTIRKQPIMSTAAASFTKKMETEDRNLKSQNSVPGNHNDKSTSESTVIESSERTQERASLSSFNPAKLNTFIRKNFHGEKRPPVSLMPRLLSKRSSKKPPLSIVHSAKPNPVISATDLSISSNGTLSTDHFPSTQSTMYDSNEITSVRKLKKTNHSKDRNTKALNSDLKRKIFKKSSALLNSTERYKKFPNKKPFTHFDFMHHTELSSDGLMSSHEETSEILIIDDQDDREFATKSNKNKMLNESRFTPFNLKARGDHQANTIDSSKLPSIEQSCGEHHMSKLSNHLKRHPIIRLPISQIEKFDCGTIGPQHHPSSLTRRLLHLPSIHANEQQTKESLTDRFYRVMSSEKNDDAYAFESIVNWQTRHSAKTEQNKFQYVCFVDPSTENAIRGRQYPILMDEIDLIDDPNACTIMNKWAFADVVNTERRKYVQESIPIKQTNKNIKICIRKRPLTQFEENIFKEVDIISITDSQSLVLHIPSITVDNQVFIRNRKFKCDQTFNEHCQINTIYQSTLSPLLDKALNGHKCLYLIGGGRYSGKTSLLRSLIDLLAFDLIRLLSSSDIYVKLLGICHNRIVDLLQHCSPIRLMKLNQWIMIPDEEYHLKTDQDIDYIVCQVKKRRRYMHQLIQINFYEKDHSTVIGSLMIVLLASSQYIYTRNLCSHRRKFLINSLNKTMLSFKRALLGIRQHPDQIRAAFNNDILTRLIHPYVFDAQSHICYVGALNPGHRHRMATKSTLEFARNLRFCLKRTHCQRHKHEKLSHVKNSNDNDDDDNIF
ncbi:unnamed protein product [Adineta ricciae]|uniref:Kinesin motor domain-containing protein n=1 Tax=Adineta ricciae TaxID=249248 RepID=A0A815DEH8_ADIRI|nr:unnamed protein product [Adineta ricciae]CAF1296742.1 unnamed protein product [Adineta ricciae]